MPITSDPRTSFRKFVGILTQTENDTGWQTRQQALRLFCTTLPCDAGISRDHAQLLEQGLFIAVSWFSAYRTTERQKRQIPKWKREIP